MTELQQNFIYKVRLRAGTGSEGQASLPASGLGCAGFQVLSLDSTWSPLGGGQPVVLSTASNLLNQDLHFNKFPRARVQALKFEKRYTPLSRPAPQVRETFSSFSV